MLETQLYFSYWTPFFLTPARIRAPSYAIAEQLHHNPTRKRGTMRELGCRPSLSLRVMMGGNLYDRVCAEQTVRFRFGSYYKGGYCVGVIGKGISIEFKKRFLQNFRASNAACGLGGRHWLEVHV